jgi:hypothetical protein
MKKLTYTKVKKVLNEVDPMGLLKAGAPENEYDTQTRILMMRRNINRFSLDWKTIKVVFEYWFYPDCITKHVAKEIEKRLK